MIFKAGELACVAELDEKQAGARGGASFLGDWSTAGLFAVACDAEQMNMRRDGQMELYGRCSAGAAIWWKSRRWQLYTKSRTCHGTHGE